MLVGFLLLDGTHRAALAASENSAVRQSVTRLYIQLGYASCSQRLHGLSGGSNSKVLRKFERKLSSSQ